MTRFSTNAAPKVKESGFALIPKGIYEATYEFADLVETKAGDMMYKFTYKITEDTGYMNRKIFDTIMWTYAPKSSSQEDIEKAEYTLEQAHGKLADTLFAVGSEGFDTDNPGEVIDIVFGKDVLIKLGVKEDKQKGEQVNFLETVYSTKGDHRTRAKAPKKTQAAPTRQAPLPISQAAVSPQDIIDRQHKAQATRPAQGQVYRQAPQGEDTPF